MRKKSPEQKKNKHNERGFMIMEAVLSIFIVGVTLVTFLAVLSGIYRAEFAKRDLIIASNLAQEGIEIVRNIRDNNWKTCKDMTISPCVEYKKAFDSPFPSGSAYYCADYLAVMGGNTGCDIGLKKNSDGFYAHSGDIITKFSRTIEITGSGDSRNIKSIVRWGINTTEMSDTLYAWGDVE